MVPDQVYNCLAYSTVSVPLALAFLLDSLQSDPWASLPTGGNLLHHLILLPFSVARHEGPQTIFGTLPLHCVHLALRNQQHGHHRCRHIRLHTTLKERWVLAVIEARHKTHTSAASCSSTRSRIRLFISCLSFKTSRISLKWTVL